MMVFCLFLFLVLMYLYQTSRRLTRLATSCLASSCIVRSFPPHSHPPALTHHSHACPSLTRSMGSCYSSQQAGNWLSKFSGYNDCFASSSLRSALPSHAKLATSHHRTAQPTSDASYYAQKRGRRNISS